MDPTGTLDLAPQQRREVVHRLHVQRSMRRDPDHALVLAQGDQPVGASELHRDLLDEVVRHGDAIEARLEFETQELAEELQAAGFRQHVAPNQHLVERLSRFALEFQRFLDLTGCEAGLAQQALADAVLQHRATAPGCRWAWPGQRACQAA